jgi:hypothetical protein
MMSNVIKDVRINVPIREVTPTTLRIIGKAIKDASTYLPLRNLAASIAIEAPRKDFAGQAKRIWDYFHTRWKYVKDPYKTETITVGPRAVFNLILGQNGGLGRGMGGGDCDCATVGLGAMYMSVGFPVRIGTTAPLGMPGVTFTHVFPQIHIPGIGWTTVDPVIVPHGGMGDIAPHSRLGIWDLKGDLICTRGVSASAIKKAFKMHGGKNVLQRPKPTTRPVRLAIPGGMRPGR